MANLDIIIRAQNLASNALRQVEGQLNGIQRNATFAERGMGGLQRAVGVGMVAAAGVAVAGVGALAMGLSRSVTAAADFESQINVLTVAARASGTSMADLSAAALQVGSDSQLVGISASEAADAMTNFYKAGLDTGEIMGDLSGYLAGNTDLTGALRTAIDLAAASELDLAQASDVVAVSMATFGLEAADAARIADVLVGAADASLASVGGLADALINVGPAAAGMGISLEDTATALALLSTRGIQGSEAGTALRSMLLNLQRPTQDVQATLDELGVSLYDAEGNFRALPDVIGSLESAMAGLTEEQRQQAAVTLAGSYGLGAFNVLVGEGTKGWTAMAGAVDSAATAQEVAAARTQGFNAAIEQLKGALETFMITVGTPLIQNFLTPAAQGLGTLVTKMTEMAPSVEEVQAGYTKLAAAGAEVLAHIDAVAGPIGEAIGQFVKWQDVLVVIGGLILYTVVPALGAIVGAAFPAIAIFAALVAAVALVRTAWEKDWGGIQGKTAAAMAVIGPLLENARAWLEEKIPQGLATLRAKWDAVWPALSGAFTAAWETIKSGLNTAKERIETALPGALTTLRTAWGTGWAAMQTVFASAWAGIQTGFAAAKTAVETNLPGALTTLQTAWATGWTAMQTAFATAKEAITTGIETIKGWFSTDVPGALTTLQTTWATVTGAIQTAWGMVVDFLMPTINKIKEAFPQMIESFAPVGGKIKELWDVAGPVILKLNSVLGVLLVAAVKLFGETIAAVMPYVGSVVGLVLDAMILAFTAVDAGLTWLMDAFIANWPQIQAAVENAWASILSAFTTIRAWLTVTLPANLSTLSTKFAEYWSQIRGSVESAWGAILGVFSAMQTWLTTTLQAAVNTFKDFLAGLSLPNPFTAISNTIAGIQNAIDRAKQAIEDFKNWLSNLRIPNPFAGLSFPSLPSWMTGGNAAGSGFFRGGLTMVGERGPELVALPRGSRIESSERTSRMVGGGVTVNVYATVSNGMDLEELAYQVARRIQRGK